MVDSFDNAGVRVRSSDSLEEALWRKLCWNVPFNGLSIVGGGITTDLILNSPELRGRAEKLMKEIQSAAKRYGVTIENSFLDNQFSLTEPMGPYKPSSLIDFLAGKTVEIESIWGEPLERGKSGFNDAGIRKALHRTFKHIIINPIDKNLEQITVYQFLMQCWEVSVVVRLVVEVVRHLVVIQG